MKIVFAGTPEFAATALAYLHAQGFDIVAVLTQPDRPSGRGQKLSASAVKSFAIMRQIPVFQPIRLKKGHPEGDACYHALQQLEFDVMVVVAYGLILPQHILDLPPKGCLNIHASLLPRWRGAAPIQRAIQAGDAETGITIMQMDAGLDTGDMLHVAKLPILETDTSQTLHDKLATLGAESITYTLQHYDSLQKNRTPQPEMGVCYAEKIVKHEGIIAWKNPATAILRQIHAFNPWPVATAYYHDADQVIPLRIWHAELSTVAPSTSQPVGTITHIDKQGVWVVCGENTLLQLTQLQWPNGKPLTAAQVHQSQKLHIGVLLHHNPATLPT